MSTQPEPLTRRTVDRVLTNFAAKVLIPGRHPLNCFVKDMSEDGALLVFRSAVWLPPRFQLAVEAMGTEAVCEIRHQRGARVGVKFLHVTVTDEPSPEQPAAPEDDETQVAMITIDRDTVARHQALAATSPPRLRPTAATRRVDAGETGRGEIAVASDADATAAPAAMAKPDHAQSITRPGSAIRTSVANGRGQATPSNGLLGWLFRRQS